MGGFPMHTLTGKWDKNRGNTLQTRGERTVHVHTYALEREDHPAVAVGHLSFSLFSALFPLLKHLAFSQAHFCSQSTADSERAREAAARNKTLF